MRRIVGVLIAIALGIGVFALWPRSSDDPPANTEAAGTSTTTTVTTVSPSTTSTVESTTTTAEASHVVETVEEAEEILRELWFGWFEGIYDQDEERIREVVVLEETVETATSNFGQMEFERPPELALVEIEKPELLMATEKCIAIWAQLDVSDFRTGAQGSSGVYVLRWSSNHWALLSVWTNRNDLWEADCESLL